MTNFNDYDVYKPNFNLYHNEGKIFIYVYAKYRLLLIHPAFF